MPQPRGPSIRPRTSACAAPRSVCRLRGERHRHPLRAVRPARLDHELADSPSVPAPATHDHNDDNHPAAPAAHDHHDYDNDDPASADDHDHHHDNDNPADHDDDNHPAPDELWW